MEYLFLRRKKTCYTSVRQKTLLYRAASRRWEKEFALRTDVRRIDALIYKHKVVLDLNICLIIRIYFIGFCVWWVDVMAHSVKWRQTRLI